MSFPQFRKYNNNKSYFKINSEESYLEINIIGNSFAKYNFKAAIYPDRVHIKNLLNPGTGIDIITQDEFYNLEIHCNKNLKEIKQ